MYYLIAIISYIFFYKEKHFRKREIIKSRKSYWRKSIIWRSVTTKRYERYISSILQCLPFDPLASGICPF